jgi:TonB-linked SusC/RagA family outer membrane protein
MDGNYNVNVSGKSSELVFSYLGFETVEEKVGNRRMINVIMKESVGELEELVVVGYGTQKKISVVGSISNVSTNDIKRIATPSLSNTLGGQLAGIVTRQSSGEPGYDQAAVYIRGLGTWVNRAPLVLVDGIERDMNTINTEEIESFSILKDASATAVYGVRGANGVILITTKQGQIGKPKISFRSEYAVMTGLRYPDYINSFEYANLVNEGRSNVGANAAYTPDELQMFADGSSPYLYPDVDWVNEILRKNTTQTINNLNITGGNEIARYFVNVGYTQQSGLYKEDNLNKYGTNPDVKRYNFRSRVDINLAKSLSAELGVGGIIQQRNFPGRSSGAIWDALRKTPPLAFPKTNPDGTIAGVMSYLGSNPWGIISQTGYETQDWNTLQGTFSAKWDLSSLVTKGLSINGRFAYDHAYYGFMQRFKDFEVKQYIGEDTEGNDIYQVHREGTALGYQVNNSANRAIYYETALNYDRTFGRHTAAGMLLFNRRDYVDITAGTSTANLPFRRQGLAGRFTYDFDNSYLAEFNFGYNGSEQFAPGKRYGFFPSLSLGWVPSNESFWSKESFFSFLKLRASVGQVGNDAVGGNRFMYLTNMNKGIGGYWFGENQMGYGGMAEGRIGYPDLTWETATKTNIGFDLHLLNDIISWQVDAFMEQRDGILLARESVPVLTGMGSIVPYGNLGKVKNQGIETMLEVHHQTATGLFYSFRGNFSFATNKILANDDPEKLWAYQSAIGKRIDQPFGLVALGFFKDQEDVDNSPVQNFQSIVRPGDIKYQDVNHDGQIDVYDEVAIGYPRMPEIMYGFGGTLAYKGFDVSAFFSGAARTSFFLEGETAYPFTEGEGSINVLKEYYDNRYIPGAEDNSNAKYPAVINGKSPNNYRRSTLWMQDGSYIRLKSAEVGYTVDKNLTKRINIAEVRLFVNGQNLLTFDKIKILDPESNNGTGSYPISRAINCGIQVNF